MKTGICFSDIKAELHSIVMYSHILCYFCQITEESRIDGLVQERRISIANVLELCLSWTNPPIWCITFNESFHIFSASHILLYEPYSWDTNALSKSFPINIHRTRGMYWGSISIYAHFSDPSNQPGIKGNACYCILYLSRWLATIK